MFFNLETDFFKKGKTIYHIDKVIRETQEVVSDGLYEIFVNAEIKDGSLISELMTCFMQKTVNNVNFPILSNRLDVVKNEGGGLVMCKALEKYNQKARKLLRITEEQKAYLNTLKKYA